MPGRHRIRHSNRKAKRTGSRGATRNHSRSAQVQPRWKARTSSNRPSIRSSSTGGLQGSRWVLSSTHRNRSRRQPARKRLHGELPFPAASSASTHRATTRKKDRENRQDSYHLAKHTTTNESRLPGHHGHPFRAKLASGEDKNTTRLNPAPLTNVRFNLSERYKSTKSLPGRKCVFRQMKYYVST